MALKPTIYKFKIMLSDLNQDYYDGLSITVAQHPSETIERMMVRVLVFCLHAKEGPVFTKGLSAADEPDIWVKTLDDQIASWLDIGEPAAERIKKAIRQSSRVAVYSFNSKSSVWWSQQEQVFSKMEVSVYQFQWEQVQAVAALAERTMDISATITENSIYIAAEKGECELSWETLM